VPCLFASGSVAVSYDAGGRLQGSGDRSIDRHPRGFDSTERGGYRCQNQGWLAPVFAHSVPMEGENSADDGALLREFFESGGLSLVSDCIEKFEDLSHLLPAQRELGEEHNLLSEFETKCLREF